ncbi:MAG: DUF106 domain-containing protein [Candidatus Brockarchaeota archaeon]|nr:DUF106 domain-containing protein [Candidatus Brockarchaeota archaeon]
MQLSNMIIVTAVSAASSIITNLATKLILHPEKIREKSETLKAFRMQREAARRLKDNKLLKKLDKQKFYISQLEKEVSSFQMRMMIINMLHFWVFIALSYFLPFGETAGYLSASISKDGGPISLPLVIWYSICMFFFMLLFRKLLGVAL